MLSRSCFTLMAELLVGWSLLKSRRSRGSSSSKSSNWSRLFWRSAASWVFLIASALIWLPKLVGCSDVSLSSTALALCSRINTSSLWHSSSNRSYNFLYTPREIWRVGNDDLNKMNQKERVPKVVCELTCMCISRITLSWFHINWKVQIWLTLTLSTSMGSMGWLTTLKDTSLALLCFAPSSMNCWCCSVIDFRDLFGANPRSSSGCCMPCRLMRQYMQQYLAANKKRQCEPNFPSVS